jgi:hypothetical protein
LRGQILERHRGDAAILRRHDEGRLAAAGPNGAAKSATWAKFKQRRALILENPSSIERRIERRALILENLVALRARALH